MISYKSISIMKYFFLIVFMVGCITEGEDAALLNNTNELEIIGINEGNFIFDQDSVFMITHFFSDAHFANVPNARLSQDWYYVDNQGNKVAVNESDATFFDAISPGDYAYSFIDINKNSEPDANESYSEWLDSTTSALKIIPVKLESRWILRFNFTKTLEQYK